MKHTRLLSILSVLTIAFTAASCNDDNDHAVCGNGNLEAGEVCDIMQGVPATCSEFDPAKAWKPGGRPACAPGCQTLTQGTCEEANLTPTAICGDGIINGNEVCDTAAAVQKSCSDFNPAKTWKNGGTPACAPGCLALTQGTCVEDTSQPGQSTDPNILSTDVVTSDRCNVSSYDFNERCDGQVAYFCSEDGYVVKRDCALLSTKTVPLSCQISVDGEYADCVETCNPQNEYYSTTCTGKYITFHQCEKTKSGGYYLYSYTDDPPCPIACDGGHCVSTTGPVVGTECNPQTFKTQCFGGNGYECKNNIVTMTTCPAGTSCAMQHGSNEFQCAESCSLFDPANNTYGCQTINGKPALDNRMCLMASDSKYYWFKETTVCQNSCDDGVCDAKIPTVGAPCNSDFSDLCAHNSVYYCRTDTHTYDVMTCGIGEFVGNQLCRYLTDSYADCTFPCDEGLEPLMQCGGSNERGTAHLDNDICEKALNGSYYMFHHEDSCPNGCEKGVCL